MKPIKILNGRNLKKIDNTQFLLKFVINHRISLISFYFQSV